MRKVEQTDSLRQVIVLLMALGAFFTCGIARFLPMNSPSGHNDVSPIIVIVFTVRCPLNYRSGHNDVSPVTVIVLTVPCPLNSRSGHNNVSPITVIVLTVRCPLHSRYRIDGSLSIEFSFST